MPVFNPQLISPVQQVPAVPQMQTAPMAEPIAETPIAPAPAPVAPPQVIMKPILVPIPIEVKPKAKGMKISPEAVRKAQGIYPAEQNKKQVMIDNAKSPPTPTGAWGAAQ